MNMDRSVSSVVHTKREAGTDGCTEARGGTGTVRERVCLYRCVCRCIGEATHYNVPLAHTHTYRSAELGFVCDTCQLCLGWKIDIENCVFCR